MAQRLNVPVMTMAWIESCWLSACRATFAFITIRTEYESRWIRESEAEAADPIYFRIPVLDGCVFDFAETAHTQLVVHRLTEVALSLGVAVIGLR